MPPDSQEAVDWLSVLGLLRYASPRRLTHVPVALTPYCAPQHLLKTVTALSSPFQLLMHRVADDWAFLEDTLGKSPSPGGC